MAFRVFTTGEVLTAALLNDYLMEQVNIVCTAGTRPSSPHEGMEIYETDTRRKLRYDGTNWVIWPPQAVEVAESTSQSTSSTTYQAGTVNCETTFLAPPSGRTIVTVTGDLEGFGTDGEVVLTYEIRLNNVSGSVLHAATKFNGSSSQGTGNTMASTRRLFTNLTPGATYYIRTMHASGTGGSSITVGYRRLLIEPQPN